MKLTEKIREHKDSLVRKTTETVGFGIPAKIADMHPAIGNGHISDLLGGAAETGVISLFFTGERSRRVERYAPPLLQTALNTGKEVLQHNLFDWKDVVAYGLGGVLFVATDTIVRSRQKVQSTPQKNSLE